MVHFTTRPTTAHVSRSAHVTWTAHVKRTAHVTRTAHVARSTSHISMASPTAIVPSTSTIPIVTTWVVTSLELPASIPSSPVSMMRPTSITVLLRWCDTSWTAPHATRVMLRRVIMVVVPATPRMMMLHLRGRHVPPELVELVMGRWRSPVHRWRSHVVMRRRWTPHVRRRGHGWHRHASMRPPALLLELNQELLVVVNLVLDVLSALCMLLATEWRRMLQVDPTVLAEEVRHIYQQQ